MKNLIAVIAILFCSTTFWAAPFTTPAKGSIYLHGGENPWPWGQESQFPIEGVQGTYASEIDGTPYMFSVRVIRTSIALTMLNIRMIDQSTCELVAQGVGFNLPTYVTGSLKAIHDNSKEFQISLRVFAETLIEPGKVDQKYIRNGMVMVVSIGEFGQIMNVDQMTSAPIRKISNSPTKKCQPLQ